MTEDHYKRLVAMLLDTVTAQQQQIDALTAEIARLTSDDSDRGMA